MHNLRGRGWNEDKQGKLGRGVQIAFAHNVLVSTRTSAFAPSGHFLEEGGGGGPATGDRRGCWLQDKAVKPQGSIERRVAGSTGPPAAPRGHTGTCPALAPDTDALHRRSWSEKMFECIFWGKSAIVFYFLQKSIFFDKKWFFFRVSEDRLSQCSSRWVSP